MLLLFLDLLSIVALFSFGHYSLCLGILNKKWNTKTFFIYFSVMLFFQLLSNAFVIYMGEPLESVAVIINLLLNTTFSLYSVFLGFLFHKNLNISFLRGFFVSAMAYFIDFTFTVSFATILMMTQPFDFEHLSEIQIVLIYSTFPYVCGAVFSLLLKVFFKRIAFYRYLPIFFSTRKREILSYIFCILLINPHYLLEFVIRKERSIALNIATAFLVVFIILFIVLIVGIVLQTQRKLQLQQTVLSQQAAYMGAMKDLHTEMRAFRHDFHNLMLGVGGHISAEDLDGVKGFMNNMSVYFDRRIGGELKYLESLMNLEHVLLKNLFSIKVMDMQKAGIEVVLSIPYPIKKILMGDEDLIRCIGVYLDNAREATETMSDGLIHIFLLQEDQKLKITIQNNYREEPMLSKLSKKGYTTKGKGHGTGLLSCRNILKRYNHVVNRTLCEEGLFTQELCIFNQ